MPRGVHKNPFLGWNPPAEDSAWARAFALERGVALSTILTEALGEYRAKRQSRAPAVKARSGSTTKKPPAAPPVVLREPKSGSKCQHRLPVGAYCRTCDKIKEG